MTPLIDLLRLCETHEKPSLAYIYDGMHKVRLGIMNVFKNERKFYKPYIDIIDSRWDCLLCQGLHAMASYLNPALQYDVSTFCKEPEFIRDVHTVINKIVSSNSLLILDQLAIFQKRELCFSGPKALACSKTIQPDEWWRLFACDVPNLQKLAIRVLGQTSSSLGCEYNRDIFEHIHTKKRNRLEHQRLDDLVYVHCNLRLKNRLSMLKRPYDPVDYELIEKTDSWVVEKEGEVDYYGWSENMIQEELPKDIGQPSFQVSDHVEHELQTGVVSVDEDSEEE